MFALDSHGPTAADWSTQSRCSGWTVGDVAAHVIGGMSDVAAFRLEGPGTPEVTARQVAERRGKSPGELADELGAVARRLAPRRRHPLRPRPPVRTGRRHDGQRVPHRRILTREGWGPAVLALDGLPEFAASRNGANGGSRFSGDPLTFVYAATGRGDLAPLGLDESANIYR